MAHSAATSTVPAPPSYPNRWRILGLLGVAQLMLILDVTVVTIALPNIAADLGLGRQQLTWVVSGYTLAFGGLLLLGGRAADLFGARRLVVLGLGVFAGASLLAGLAPTGWALLAGRVLQGLSAAVLSPSALSLVVTTFDGAERDRALGIWSALGGGGAALGVLLGGLLTAGPGWSWVFFVNVPVGEYVYGLLEDETLTGTLHVIEPAGVGITRAMRASTKSLRMYAAPVAPRPPRLHRCWSAAPIPR
jgi:MFS family permease